MGVKVVALVFLVDAIAQIQAGCLCGFTGEGKDICSGPKCTPMVVRPAPLPKLNFDDFRKSRVICKQIGGLPGLKPVGDLCSCRQSIVMPALVPKPACACNAGSSAYSSSGSSSSSSASSSSSGYSGGFGGSYGGSSSYGGSYGGGSYGAASMSGSNSGSGSSTVEIISANPTIYETEGTAYNVAADPVSLTLAYKMQNKACGISEGPISFGFQKMPIDGSKAKIVKNIPEENLYKLNGQIVELKPISCSKGMTVDEEAMEEMMAQEFAAAEEEESSGVKKLSYGEIGFGPAKIQATPFVAVQGIVEANPQPINIESAPNCNDGFVPGNMIIRNIPRQEVYVPGPGNPCDIESSSESVPVRLVSSFSTSSSSSSSSSNHNRHHSSYSYNS